MLKKERVFLKDILDLFNNENRYYKMVEDIIKAIESHSLFLFIGAGVSIGQGYPDWNKYVEELLRYWTYRLSDLNKDKSVKREDILFLNYVAESNMDKKRKIDIMHYLIKEYQKDPNENVSELLKFERMYFREIEPIERINKTLKELVKLEATFITTNYDNQIEKHYTQNWGRNLKVFEDVSKLNGRVPADSIIYLHGHPDGDPHHFINSSSSYSKLYYEENERLNIFRQFLQSEVDPTILFIGCSMEEEEILAFLNKQYHTKNETKYYALMRYDKKPSLAKCFNEHMYQFYKNEKNVEFIWYGESHEQLPVLVRDLVSRVNEKLTSKKERDMQTILRDNSETTLVLNNAKDENDFYFLTRVFKSYLESEEKDVENFFIHLFNSEIITQGKLKDSAEYASLWQLFSLKFELLSDVEKNMIFDLIAKIQNVNLEVALSIGKLILKSNHNNYQGKKKYLGTIYKRMGSYNLLKKLDDNELYCLYFNELIVAKQRVWVQKNIYQEKLIFNYSNESFDDLLKVLEKLDYETIYSDFEYNMKFSSVSLIFNCIKAGLLKYENSYEFPDEFYNIKIVQKIFVNLDLDISDEEKSKLLMSQIDQVKNKIDYTDALMGKEMNEFHAKHFPDTPKKVDCFIDGISMSESGPIEYYPYLNISELLSLSDEEIVHTLEKSSGFLPLDRNDFSKSRYVSAQSEAFDELFTGDVSDKLKDNVKEILILLIDNEILCQRYGTSINKYFMKSNERTLKNKNVLKLYLKNMKTDRFTWVEKNIYKYIIEEELYIQLDFFKEKITSYDIAQFKLEEMTDEAGFIDFNKFINTSIGRFFNMFQLLAHQSEFLNLGFDQLLNENIKKLEDVSVRNYVMGAFFDLYTVDESDILFFQGAVHFNKIRTQDELGNFIHVIKPILSSDFDDDYCIVEVCRILINYYQPQKMNLKNADYMKKISNMMFRWLVIDIDMTKYGEEWFTEFIKNEFTAKYYIESLVFSSGEIPVEKYKRILKIIDEHVTDTIKIDSYHIRFTSGKKEELTQHSKLIKLLLNKEVIDKDRDFLEELKSLLQELKDAGEKDEIKDLIPVLRKNLTEKDSRDLSMKFKEL